ncbi:MAG TPA: cupin domain-containing protein [Stellaceae bacterium]|jgi:quercetin dioxygenase-like cupin family protein|nr:cupin domain-containing protein [Stellaceae bacterium]
MDRTAFEAILREQGYHEVFDREMAASTVNPTHTHDFDAQLLILGGEMTIVRDGVPHTYRAGDSCEMPAGTLHEERVGPQGVSYIAGRRRQAAAAN